MKKRLHHIEMSIVEKQLSKTHGLRVLILAGEPDWRLSVDSGQHDFFYGLKQPVRLANEKIFVVSLSSLPIAPQSMDLIVLPHVMHKSQPLATLLNALNDVLKPNGRLLFIGINNSEQYSADVLRQGLKKLGYQLLKHRGYHLLPFLGARLSQCLDTSVGQFLPWLGSGYWVLARKRIEGVRPLKLGWNPAVRGMAPGKVGPLAGRVYKRDTHHEN